MSVVPTLCASAVGYSANKSSFTLAVNVPNSASRVMLVGASYYWTTFYAITSISAGSVALTQSASSPANANHESTSLWYLTNPATGAYNITINLAGSVDELAIGAAVYANVLTSSPILGTGSGSNTNATATITLTSGASALSFAQVNKWDTPLFSAQSVITTVYSYEDGDQGQDGIGIARANTDGASTMVLSGGLTNSQLWGIVGLTLRPAADPTGGAIGFNTRRKIFLIT